MTEATVAWVCPNCGHPNLTQADTITPDTPHIRRTHTTCQGCDEPLIVTITIRPTPTTERQAS